MKKSIRNFMYKDRFFKLINEKNSFQRFLCRKAFDLFQLLGIHITADHFYELIPNTVLIERKYRDYPRNCPYDRQAFSKAEKSVIELLERYSSEFYEACGNSGYKDNYYFRGLDALILYCFVRDKKPKRVIEVGQGFSTLIILAALERNAAEITHAPEFVSIDLYDRLCIQKRTKIAPASQTIKYSFINKDLVDVSLETFSVLEESDLLFIDSTHVYKFGSDVKRLFEEIYPGIPKGVYIHIHDIFTPYEYPLKWMVKEKKFWNEQYYLENFLLFNSAFEVFLPVYMLIRESASLQCRVKELCRYEGFRLEGSSFYVKRK